MEECCSKKKGVVTGIIYGIIPHCGCILFIVFAVLGVTAASSFLRPLLTNAFFFHGLIILSFVLSTISAVFYLRRQKSLSLEGVKRNWKYLLILYGTVIAVNLLIFQVIFPNLANLQNSSVEKIAGVNASEITLEVDIPCSGHAFLVMGDVGEVDGVFDIQYRFPNMFDISYSPQETSFEEILSVDIFEEFEAKVVND